MYKVTVDGYLPSGDEPVLDANQAAIVLNAFKPEHEIVTVWDGEDPIIDTRYGFLPNREMNSEEVLILKGP